MLVPATTLVHRSLGPCIALCWYALLLSLSHLHHLCLTRLPSCQQRGRVYRTSGSWVHCLLHAPLLSSTRLQLSSVVARTCLNICEPCSEELSPASAVFPTGATILRGRSIIHHHMLPIGC